jgi:hypothetical protein
MGRAELDMFRLASHGRDYSRSDDGYSDMEAAEHEGWRSRSSWGADGWDLGNWPYVSFQMAEREGRYLLQTIVEGDHEQWSFPTAGDRDAAIDYLFLWYAAGQEWVPLTWEQRGALDAGGFTVEPKFRGPYRDGVA